MSNIIFCEDNKNLHENNITSLRKTSQETSQKNVTENCHRNHPENYPENGANYGRKSSIIDLPKGNNARCAILKCILPKLNPIMVK